MLIIIAGIILCLVGVIVFILIQFRPEFPYTWLLSVSASMIAWLLVLISHWLPPDPLWVVGWIPYSLIGSTILFVNDSVSWPYAFGLASVLLAVMLTLAIDILPKSGSKTWAGSLFITGMGLVVVLAGNALTLILAWAALDIVEFIILIRSINGKDMLNRSVLSFSARILGVFLVIWSMFMSYKGPDALTFNFISPEVGVFMLLAVGLRLGVIPLHLPYTREFRLRRGFGSLLRLISAASSLVVLARLPDTVVQPTLAVYLLIFTALASLYGALMWVTAPNELDGRPYWLVALAGMAVGSVIRGKPEASIAWGLALILVGGLIFLYSSRRRETIVFSLLAVVGLSGLPFTPSASGWYGLVVEPFSLLDIIYIIAHAFLILGILRLTLNPGNSLKGMERWLQIIYLSGLTILIISHWIIGVFGWEGSFTTGTWWASTLSIILAALTYFLSLRNLSKGVGKDEIPNLTWITYLWNVFGIRVAVLFRLDWLYRLIYKIFRILQGILTNFTALLEGQGGILWTFLLMILVVTLLREGNIR